MNADRCKRVSAFIDFLKISNYAFATHTGIANANISRMTKGLQSVTDNTLLKIAKAYPQVNLTWLKTGEGEMLNPNCDISQTTGGAGQQGLAGNNLNQSINSDNVVHDFLEGIKSQNKLIERAMDQTDKAMDQTDMAMRATSRAMDQTERVLVSTSKAIDEISEQRKLIERLISNIETSSNK